MFKVYVLIDLVLQMGAAQWCTVVLDEWIKEWHNLSRATLQTPPWGTLNGQMGWLLKHYFILKCDVEINYFNCSYMLLKVAAKWRSFCRGYCLWLPVCPFIS